MTFRLSFVTWVQHHQVTAAKSWGGKQHCLVFTASVFSPPNEELNL
jgi:hypothetical protein